MCLIEREVGREREGGRDMYKHLERVCLTVSFWGAILTVLPRHMHAFTASVTAVEL